MARTLETAGVPALPLGVRDLVARRLDRLTARSQELVAVAAVIGRRFDFTVLRAVGSGDERETAAAVEETVRHHVLQAVGTQLDFTHDRIREVAYARLLPPRRVLLHRAMAEALETDPRAGDRFGERIEQLAHHALRGELRDRAVGYLRRAGGRAAARSALQDACTWFEEALRALETLPETRSTLEEAFEVRLELHPILIQLGEFQRVLARLGEAETLAERLGDDGRRGRVLAFLTAGQARLEDPARAIVSGRRALEIAERLGDRGLRILTTSYLGLAHFYLGEYTRVVELTRSNLAALPPDQAHDFFGGSQPASVNSYFRLLASLAHLGRFAETAGYEVEIVRIAERTRHPYTIGLAYHAASLPHLIKGNWSKAHALIEHQIAAWRGGNIVDDLPMTLAFSARALARLGDATESLSRLREGERLLADRSARGRSGLGSVYASLGHACLLLGRLDDAQRFAERSMASVSGRIDFVPYTLHLLGDIASHPDRFDAARGEAHYRDALGLAEPRGMRPLVAHCHFGLGRLHTRAGRGEPAAMHLETAATMYRDMDMLFWLDKVEAESR